jgi:hypothetical protein
MVSFFASLVANFFSVFTSIVLGFALPWPSRANYFIALTFCKLVFGLPVDIAITPVVPF